MTELNDYRQELKEKILELAMQEFSQRGLRDIKMDDMARRLHISKRTLYEIYADKETLLLEGLQRHRQEMEQEMERYSRQEGVNAVDIVARFLELQMEVESNVSPQFYTDIRKCPRIMAFLTRSQRKHDSEARDFMERGIREGLFREDLDYEMVNEISRYLLDAVLTHKLYEKYSMKDIVRNFPMILVRGICTEKGIAMLDKALGEHAMGRLTHEETSATGH